MTKKKHIEFEKYFARYLKQSNAEQKIRDMCSSEAEVKSNIKCLRKERKMKFINTLSKTTTNRK